MGKLHFTRHARRRIKWRRISQAEVTEALACPDRIEHLPEGKINAFKSIGNKMIRVTYIEEGTRIVVISVVDKNK